MIRNTNLIWWAGLIIALPLLACTIARQTPQPTPELAQLAFEIQTSTPTPAPVLALADVATYTPDPNATPTPTQTITPTLVATSALQAEAIDTEEPVATEAVVVILPTSTPEPTATVAVAEPLRGGEWDFEVGFTPWPNPFGDSCDGAALADGWSAFTTRDQFGSSCMNQTTWADNVYGGVSAQEITFAYIGNQAGIFKTAPTVPGHRYTVEAFMRREFSPAKVEVSLGIDLSGGQNWEAETVQWFPWDEDFENEWSRTEETVTATGDSMTIFIKGSHPYPEPGGTLRLDSISVVDLGPE